jgi:hypothetical protein
MFSVYNSGFTPSVTFNKRFIFGFVLLLFLRNNERAKYVRLRKPVFFRKASDLGLKNEFTFS